MTKLLQAKGRFGNVEYGLPLRVEETKTVGDGWTVEGYCSTWNNEDRVGDVVAPGAFTKTLADDPKTLFLYCHDLKQMLGVPLVLQEDQKGLFGRFKISKTQLGETIHTLMADGAPFGFSIGFFPDEFEYNDAGQRVLKQIGLVENTLAPLPIIANPEAQVTAFKTLLGLPDLETRAVWSTAYVNDLEDSCFAGVEPGGEKDDEGKTTPRSLRHLPHHAKGNGGDGPVDRAHLANALSRVEQMEAGGAAFRDKCQSHLMRHARAMGMGDHEGDGKTLLSLDDFNPAEMPFDVVWQGVTNLFTRSVAHTKSLYARRAEEGRKPSDRQLALLRTALDALEGASAEVKHLLTTPAPVVEEAEADSAQPMQPTDLQQRMADLRRKLERHPRLVL